MRTGRVLVFDLLAPALALTLARVQLLDVYLRCRLLVATDEGDVVAQLIEALQVAAGTVLLAIIS